MAFEIDRIKYREFIEENFEVLDFKKQVPVPFVFNKVQSLYYDILTEKYPNMAGVREIVLKARREGMTSFILALLTVDFILRPHSVGVCIAHRRDVTELIFKTVKDYLESFIRRQNVKKKSDLNLQDMLSSETKGMIVNKLNKASLYIGTAGSRVGIRGTYATNILFCLSSDQLVIGKDGFVTPIKDFPKRVRDGNGAMKDVLDLSKRVPDEDMLALTIAGTPNLPIKATLSHKLLCLGEDSKPVWKQTKDITTQDYIAFPLTSGIKNIPAALPLKFDNKVVEFTEDFGELCGWYLAEGSVGKGRIDLTVNLPELEYVKGIVEKNKHLFKSYSVYLRENHAVISIFGNTFVKFLSELLGTKDNKVIRDKFWLYGKDFLRGLLRGLIKGDGCNKVRGVVTFTSIRPQLIVQIKRLLISLRLGYPLISIDKANNKRNRNNKEKWTLIMSGKTATNFREFLGLPTEAREDGRKKGYNKFFKEGLTHYYAKVRKIEKIEREEEVYDIVMDQVPHSFSLVSGVSHNSEAAFYMDTEMITAEEMITASSILVPTGVGKIFIESTANGEGNYYHKEWQRAYVDKNSNYNPRFFGWQTFYTPEEVEAKRKDFANESMWLQEFPPDPESAFRTSGAPFFDISMLQAMLAKKEPIIARGRLASDGEFV